ncbi:hypothetical protein GJ496_011749 [Pomphorhynchus laevis]|nr:hypothetical protein GJ496_011749 [Pomphorhynchus laevis]
MQGVHESSDINSFPITRSTNPILSRLDATSILNSPMHNSSDPSGSRSNFDAGCNLKTCSNSRPRLLKTVFRSADNVQTIISKSHRLKGGNIRILKDLSLEYRKVFKVAKEELLRRFDEVREWVLSSSLDIVAILKTWLHSDIPDCIMQIPGYQIFRSDRNTRKGNADLQIMKVLVNSYQSCSDMMVTVFKLEYFTGLLNLSY